MATVFIGYATRSGTTTDIAGAVAEQLRDLDHTVDIVNLKDRPELPDADLIVLGSGINGGAWYGEATAWVSTNAARLQSMNVALFNACLNAANPDKRAECLAYNKQIADKVQPEANESFAGRYVPAHVGWFRRVFLKALQQAPQDHVDLDAVRRWAATLIA
ncbi:MAG TPA: flavodoxin domain-containing protein [Tessaracoccus flavescens]|uniref:Flavodoxin domain-containing protein n=1 Tax=Tessaracoccus flavescens TaxID=399497 RepID=A0A921EQI3_9ACTN|nr:flavodoxin domain-containing protein [Tessaracoccus flavescens]